MERSREPHSALVTGANGGIGRVIVSVLAEHGIRVAAAVRSHSPDKSPEWQHPPAVVLEADVTDETSVQRLFAEAARSLHGIDLVVNTVGGYLPATPLSDLAAAEWDRMMTLNLRSTFLCTREAIRTMGSRSSGVIVNFSAMVGLDPAPGRVAYAVAKSGVELLTRTVADEVRGSGIALYALAPGVVATEANASWGSPEEQAQRVTPREIAEAIFALARGTPAASGSVLRLNGRP